MTRRTQLGYRMPVDENDAKSLRIASLEDEVADLNAAINHAIGVLRMVDDNHRVDAGEKLKAWNGDFVIAQVRQLLK